MLKTAVCTALLACSFGATAADWQHEFFSPMTNELPSARGVAVDDLGYVHLQAYNRQSAGAPDYFLAHQYTIRSDGQIPWIWGISQADRMSDCGVYAKTGQRLDCKRSAGFWGRETRLEMRGTDHAYVVWENTLPGDVTVLDASIPQQNQALVLGQLDSPQGVQLGVYRADSPFPAEILSLAPACAHPGQTLQTLRARMPRDPGESILAIKACWNSFGNTELTLDEFDPRIGAWNTRSTWWLPYGSGLARAEIGPQGQPYALIENADGTHALLTIPQFIDQWIPVPLPIQAKIAGFLVGDRGLAIVNAIPPEPPSSDSIINRNSEYSISWFDNDAFWPIVHFFGEFEDLAPKAFALSVEGDVIVLGSPLYTPAPIDRLLLARRDRQLLPIGVSPLSQNEIGIGTTYLIGSPKGTAVVARTIARDQGFGDPQLGVRVNQYDLP